MYQYFHAKNVGATEDSFPFSCGRHIWFNFDGLQCIIRRNMPGADKERGNVKTVLSDILIPESFKENKYMNSNGFLLFL